MTLCLQAAVVAGFSQSLPPLPQISLESLPSAARLAITAPYRAAAAAPRDAARVGALAETLHAWELWEASHQAYARAAHLDTTSFAWRYLDAAVLQRLARHVDAADRLREALKLSPGYLPARLMLAEELFEAGDIPHSRPLFLALVDEPAARPAAEVGLGRIAAAEGAHEEAIAHLQRAIALFPELGAAHYALALSYRALGRRDEAERALELHARYGPRWPAVPDPVLDRVLTLREDPARLLQRGVKLAESGEVEAAIAAHEAALARDPGLRQAHANLISLYGRIGNWAKAEDHYRAAVASDEGMADAHYDYGVLLGLQEKWDLAADAYRRALAANPLHARAHNNLGQTLERLGRLAEATDAYRHALESEPGFRLARFNLGRMLIALGKPGEAALELEKIVEPRDAEAPRYLFALGVARLREGRRDEGVRWSIEAKNLALQFDQRDLAAAIDRELASLKER